MREIKKFHLNALQLSISVHQRCSVPFKMHKIHIRPGLCPICTLGSSPHSVVGWDLEQGGAAGRTFAPGAKTLTPPLGQDLFAKNIFARKINKMPEFHMIIAQKYFSRFFFGGGRLGGAPPPVSYTYGREGINLPHGRLKTLAALHIYL